MSNATNTYIWLLATAGSALVLTQSAITEPLRKRLSRYAEQRFDDHRTWPPCPKCRAWYSWKIKSIAAKLISCPMCSGFWLGLGWAALLGSRGAILAAYAFGGSIVSALAVAAWIALVEAQQALALWRYNNSKDPPPEGVCEERMQLALREACSDPLNIACPRHGVWERGERCPVNR